ncbi:MAG: C39 family peptidase [Eubacteriales bacterium]
MTRNTLDFIKIKDGRSETLGANQYWFPQKFAALSGCGPTTAAEILAYLAKQYPTGMQGLPPESFGILERKTFVQFMRAVREYVKPGVMGLTDIDFYTNQTINYAKSCGVALQGTQIDVRLDTKAAYQAVIETIDAGRPLALLVLTNPNPDIREYTWHWMTIIGYDKDKGSIIIATHGRPHALNFSHVWVNGGGHKAGMVHFMPKGV